MNKYKLKFIVTTVEELGFKARTVSTIFTADYLMGRQKNYKINDECYSNLMNEIVKWLIDEHGIYVNQLMGFGYSISIYGKYKDVNILVCKGDFNSREEATLDALTQCAISFGPFKSKQLL